MNTKAEELLTFLLWSADKMMRPTFRNLTDSYESWAYKNGLYRQMYRMEKLDLVEARRSNSTERVFRITAKGRVRALGGRDPEVYWSRNWDGKWRMVLFDIPVSRNAERRRLRRYLNERGFGCLQDSVWITPDPLDEEKRILAGAKVDAASLLLLDARPCAGESDAEIVGSAWNFKRINRRYLRLIEVLEARPGGPVQNETSAKALLRWATAERDAWLDAVTHDPLLPESLLPEDYLGQSAWRKRLETFRQAGTQIQNCSWR